GGFQAWQEAGLSTNRGTPEIKPSDYEAQLNQNLLATTADVAAQVDNPQTRLVDARPHNYYVGEIKAPTAALAGTIKNAINVENGVWFEPGTSTSVSAAQARRIAEQKLNQPADETISFCNTGHWAATDWFALSEVVGLDNVRLYATSLAEWSQDADLPMQNVPSRGTQILRKSKGIIE